MINEERVKELFQVALYDQDDDLLKKQVRSYFKSDYVGKEIIKSFFLGTLAFIFIIVLCVLYNIEIILGQINSLDLVQVGIGIGMIYAVFMSLYLFLTALVYTIKYNKEKIALKKYGEHIKKLNKMYEREEKLRQ